MRVPLEILRMILEQFAASSCDGTTLFHYRYRPFLPLRYVNTVFAEEVLSALFSRLDPPEANKLLYASWQRTPSSLREKYLYYRTFKHPGDNRLFTYLFNPVFECQLARLGIHRFNHFARHEKLTEWCKYFMHERWGLSWVVTHCQLEYVNDLDDCYDECQEGDQPERRVENDRKFLEICCAIINDDDNAVLQEFAGFCSGVDDLNYCFGTTLLGFALKWGSPEMLRLLLRSMRSIPQSRFYIYLDIVTSRKCAHSETMVKALLDHFSGFDTRKRPFTTSLMATIVSAKDKVNFDAVLLWLTTASDFPGKLSVLEWLCKHVVARSSAYDLLTYPSPTPHTHDLSEISRLIPAYQQGLAYQRYLECLFLAVHPMVWWFPVRGVTVDYKQKPKVLTPPTALFLAASKGLLHWVDWLLWAGADARHEEGEVALLDFAWNVRKRREVAGLLRDHGWDLSNLMLKIG